MSTVINITGQVFTRLTAIGRNGGTSEGEAVWTCRCSCGRICQVRGWSLRSGNTKSCGCLIREKTIARSRIHGSAARGKRTRTYKSWAGMIQRCTNPKNSMFSYYGGRGLAISGEWRSFQTFLQDMGECPSPKHTIERRDNEAGYSPENCIWATMGEQGNNKRNNRHITSHGETLTLAQWAKRTGISRQALDGRLKKWPTGKALTEPVRTSRRGDLYTYQGEALTLAQWARRVNLRIDTLFLRFKSGKTLAEALTIPLRGKIS